MAACASMRSGDAYRTSAIVDSLILRYPESTYLPEAFILAARACELRTDSRAAIRHYTFAALRDASVMEYCASGIRALLEALPTQDRTALAEKLLSDGVSFQLLQQLAIIPGAAQATGPLSTKPLDRGPVLVAVLPLTQVNKRVANIARDLRDGMLIAVEQFNEGRTPPAVLHLRDASNPDTVEALLNELHAHAGPDAMLVGALSDDAKHCLQSLAPLGLPILLPSANEADLAESTPTIFQCNSPLATRAGLLADYVHLALDADEVMILEKMDPQIIRMTDAFVSRWHEQKRTIRVQRWSTQSDLTIAVKSLSGTSRGKGRLLIAPAMTADDIAMILRAATNSTGTIQLLGMGNWHQEDVLHRYPTVDVIFESDEPAGDQMASMDTVRTLFRKRTGRSITKHAMFGYDACRIALEAARKSIGDPAAFIRAMHGVFDGIRAPINFSTGRVNKCISLYRFTSGRINTLESFYAK